MGRQPSRDLGLTGFLLGIITSSALTLLLSSYSRRPTRFKVDEGDKTKDAADKVEREGAIESTIEASSNGRDFVDVQIGQRMANINELQLLLRRARAINSLAHTLTVAPDEKSCFEEVSRLIVPLFRIDACAFGLMKVSLISNIIVLYLVT